MRMLLAIVYVVMISLTAVAVILILPADRSEDAMIDAYFAVGDDPDHPKIAALMDGFSVYASEAGLDPFGSFAELLSPLDSAREEQDGYDGAAGSSGAARYRQAFSDYFLERTGRSLDDVPRLVWSTDNNPAREVQLALFRRWHLQTYGEPLDIVADPSNRQLTKAIIQSVAGAGADIIEYYGPSDLLSLVQAGIAYEITGYANYNDFGVDTVFEAARSSIAIEQDNGGWRQYGYPCNIGYTVLLYHQDLVSQAGEHIPEKGWTIDEMRAIAERVLARDDLSANPKFGIMNLGAWDASIAAGGRFFPQDGVATHSVYNSPETIAGLRAYQDLMYVHGTMPRPAEAASMSAGSAGGFGGGSTVSAPGLFVQKSIIFYVGGRWEYVTFAKSNYDRILRPAINRRLAELAPDDPLRPILDSTKASLDRDVLLTLTEEQIEAARSCLSQDDRERMLNVGVAHIPTAGGTPSYSVAARGAVINRALERTDPQQLEYAKRFLRFLASEAYNEQINGTFDSICGRFQYCEDEDGISGPPPALPGLTAFDSPVFTEALRRYARSYELSPYIGFNRMSKITGDLHADVQSNRLTPEDAAWEIEQAINRQILDNVLNDARLRDRWVTESGVDPRDIDPTLRDEIGNPVTIREQIETLQDRAVKDLSLQHSARGAR